ncbi:MAG: 30S ribosome-binding factor RbfA [Chlamydiales bacterium]|nr:30S ribosome-binding factor RbfA [Chlamydiales bacterium]
MGGKRTDKLNSLLQEVISEVIRQDVRNPHVHPLVAVTKVEITSDLSYAKVFISIIGTDEEKAKTVQALQSAAGFIAIHASKKIVLRHFPELTFKVDDSVEKQIRIDSVIHKIKTERELRENKNNNL